jgi:hypothetical protein
VIWVSLAGAVLVSVGQAPDADLTEGFSGGRNPLGVDSPPVEAAWPVGLVLLVAGLVAAVVSSVLRYRLYDIDVLINRTLVYAHPRVAVAPRQPVPWPGCRPAGLGSRNTIAGGRA